MIYVRCSVVGADFMIIKASAVGLRPWGRAIYTCYSYKSVLISLITVIQPLSIVMSESYIFLTNFMLIWSSDVTLENLTVVPVSLSTVRLRWNINPTNGHHCVVNFTIQVTDKDGSLWRAQTLGNNKSFLLTELQLTPLKEYTYCITANTIHPNQAGPTVKQKSTMELHGMFEHITCKRLTVINP